MIVKSHNHADLVSFTSIEASGPTEMGLSALLRQSEDTQA